MNLIRDTKDILISARAKFDFTVYVCYILITYNSGYT